MIHKMWSAFFLLFMVGLTVTLSTAFMTFAFIVGTPMAANGSVYWFNVWIAFDKLCNAALKGDHDETISSRLGKSTIYEHDPVFFTVKIDRVVAWMLDQVDPGHCESAIDWRYGEALIETPYREAA